MVILSALIRYLFDQRELSSKLMLMFILHAGILLMSMMSNSRIEDAEGANLMLSDCLMIPAI